ncbi:MAG TPA: efflux RND transporter periplasmic adaptor subunit [Devosia sp.]|nr:efflux RND transporter periplasmic adaptor subunit [Devosia sp.]
MSILVLVVAAAGYIYFVPGSDQTLKSLGINAALPTAYAASGDAAPPAGAQKAQGGTQRGGRPGGPGGFARQTPTVITLPVTTSTIDAKLSAIGQGTAVQSVSVTTQATGTLVKFDVKPGDKVKAGQVIAELDSDAEQIAYDKANLAAKDAADTLARTKSLAQSNNATTAQLNTAQLAADTANLELRNAKLALDKRTITTPIDGTIGLYQVTPGNAVGAQTVVTTIDDTSSLLVNYWVPERYAPVIKPGMPVTAQPVALPGTSITGEVTAVDSRIDPTSRTLEVQATVPNKDGAITPGMAFQVSMGFPGDTYPAVDPLAIQWGSTGSYVWQLTPDSKVKKSLVQIIQRNSDGILVKGDIKPGDEVVTQGVLLLSEGIAVRRIGGDQPGAANTADGTGDNAGAPAKPRRGNGAGATQG